MATTDLIEIVPTEEMPAPRVGRAPRSTAGTPPEPVALNELPARLGHPIFVPSYLPSGFSLTRSALTVNGGASLLYEKASKLGGLLLEQGTLGARWRTRPGSYREVMVSGQHGYLVRGVWTQRYNMGNPVPTVVWTPNGAATLLFQRGTVTVTLGLLPGDLLSDAEILKIAESLQPYTGE